MTTILGISAFYHDSAAALVVDGEIVAAAQEERFTRVKHDFGFPVNAIRYCLEEGGITPEQLDYVGFYDKPFLKFERLLETYLAYTPVGFKSFLKAMPLWLRQKLHLPREISRGLGGGYHKRVVFTEHHESHAASAFFPSPFEEAAILTLDGVGEWATASFGYGRGNRVTLTHELHFPHSLGLLYSAFTYFCGFKVNSGEYKLMGLAPYGEPRYAEAISEKLLHLKDDGSFRMDMSYFDYCQGLTMTSKKFEAVFGGPPRRPESPLTQREMDMAASVQVVTEEIMMRAARHLHAQTGMKNLCLAGGVALNCVGNGRILRDGPFERIWIQPAAGDAGGALGVALFIWHQLLGHERKVESPDAQRASLLGPRFSNEQIRTFLDERGAAYHRVDDEGELIRRIVDLIEQEKVVGLLQGRMEFGPRALGCRSIIGDARSRAMQSVMNLKIKFRESFRPFAPIVLRERVSEFFEMRDDEDSPYMLLVAPLAEAKRLAVDDGGAKGLDKLKVIRSQVPAITHVDFSARVQTVDAERHGRLYRLMKAFEARTGCPVMINTSFNVRGEPIVCSPEHAYHCFMGTDMDVLVLENHILLKDEQPKSAIPKRDEYLAKFALD
jgi:carbamoyltransferase